MGKLRILNRDGDAEIPFTKKDYTPAQEQFEALIELGEYWAYKVEGAHGGEVLRKFDPTAEQIIVSPKLIGG